MTQSHYGFHVEGTLQMLRSIRDDDLSRAERSRLEDLIKRFEEAKQHGERVVSSCPEAVEVEPRVWQCPGHE